MGMMARLVGMLRGSRRPVVAGAGSADASPSTLALELASLDQERATGPVAMDMTPGGEAPADFDDGYITFHSPASGRAELDADARSPRNKQELIHELQKNYAEVLHLVRKVDHHLDEQARRSSRLLELAERMPQTVAELAAIREQHASLLDRVDQLATETREGRTRAEESRQRQVAALAEVKGALEATAGTERRVAESLDEFRGAMSAVAGSTDRLNDALAFVREREDDRDATLARVIVAGQKWVVTAVILGLVCLGAVVVMGIVAMGVR